MMIAITDTLSLNEHDIKERFTRASGPRGQNVNKDATAVELRFDVRGSSLPVDVRDRLLALGGRRVTTDGVLVVDSRVHRSQAQNREAARARLLALLQRAATPRKRRLPTGPAADVRERRLASKQRRSAVKQSRGRSPREYL
jgi:ribosome-associated protein